METVITAQLTFVFQFVMAILSINRQKNSKITALTLEQSKSGG